MLSKALHEKIEAFYRWPEPVSWLIIRVTAALVLIPLGWPKFMVRAACGRVISSRYRIALALFTTFAIPLRAGGPYSLDRAIGREL